MNSQRPHCLDDDRLGPPLARFFLYALLLSAMLEAIVLAQRKLRDNSLFDEGGVLEWTQLGLLLASSFLLLLSSFRFPSLRESCRLLAFLPLMAGVRELDHKFDNLIGRGTWGMTCIFLGTFLAMLTFRWRRQVFSQIALLAQTRSFGYLASAFLLVMSISRIIGQKVFWKALLNQEKYTRDAPRAVEELGELSGYFILFCGVLELYFMRTHRRSPVPIQGQNPASGEPEPLAGASAR